jgi:hypothetical protein
MYEFIDSNAAEQIRAERIHHLEIQHFRLGLEFEETPENLAIKDQMAELERRMEMHRRILGLAPLATPGQENGQDTVVDEPAAPAGEA